MIDLDALAKVIAGIATLASFIYGAYRVSTSARKARDLQPIVTYRNLVKDLTTQLDNIREDVNEDREANRKRQEELQDQITKLKERERRRETRMKAMQRRIEYLTQLLRENAPHVVIEPEEDHQ